MSNYYIESPIPPYCYWSVTKWSDSGIAKATRLSRQWHKQDKVNYAVSEREDRETDLTTLTRMTGYTGRFWAATGLY